MLVSNKITAVVGERDGVFEGRDVVGVFVGEVVGLLVAGDAEGACVVGAFEGFEVTGLTDGERVGLLDGLEVTGALEGERVGLMVGEGVGGISHTHRTWWTVLHAAEVKSKTVDPVALQSPTSPCVPAPFVFQSVPPFVHAFPDT